MPIRVVTRAITAGVGFLATGSRITVVDEIMANSATGMMMYPCMHKDYGA